MTNAKDITVRPIAAADARRIVKALHYSGKVVANSQLHFGAFVGDQCGGAISLGPSIFPDNVRQLVAGTRRNEFLELNRVAFADWLPRNGESRCLGVVFRLLRRRYGHLKWVISYADASQCGDGSIYRATGFLLTQIAKTDSLRVNPATGAVTQRIAARNTGIPGKVFNTWEAIPGFQLRYIKLLHEQERTNLRCPVLPYSAIQEAGAGMYRGRRVDR